MKYSPYPEYAKRESQWLGRIPSHWTQVPMKRVWGVQGGFAFKSSDFQEDGIPIIRMSNLKDGVIDLSNARCVDDDSFVKEFLLSEGNILIGMSGSISNFATVDAKNLPCLLNQRVGRFRKTAISAESRFLWYFIQCDVFRRQMELLAEGTAQLNISSGDIGTFVFVQFPEREQTAIANFLDRETGRIDALISKQRELIELLGEKRRALISRCVTRGLPPAAAEAAGLDPHPKLKPTGIDWLGDVPEHWEVKPLKHVNEMIRDGTHLPPPRCDQGIPLLSVRNIVGGKFINLSDDSNISESDFQELNRSFVMKANDVLLAIVGATLGKVAIVPDGMNPFHIQRSLCVLRPNRAKLSFRLLAYWLRSKGFQDLLWTSVGFSAQPGIYLSSLKDFPVVVPPLEEQTAIANFLDAETAKLDRLVSKAEEMIDRLQEYRTALITAAVTGKIDVREEVPTEEETRNEPVFATSTGDN